MKTQMTLVQHHEDNLEDKRQHCKHPPSRDLPQDLVLTNALDIKVVEAFKSALDLLTR